MRIIAGTLGGRKLEVPRGKDIRPTSDKVRGGIFNALAARGLPDGLRVLDGFCGSGALGLEALSRGADSCLFIDKAQSSLALTKRNAQALDVAGQSRFLLGDCGRAALFKNQAAVDLVFLDPPYGHSLVDKALEVFVSEGILARGAVIVIEESKIYDPVLSGSFSVRSEKIYGDTKIVFLDYEVGQKPE